jgi:hypothetical protein
MNKHRTGKLPNDFALAECFANNNTAQMLDCMLQKMPAMLNNPSSSLSDAARGCFEEPIHGLSFASASIPVSQVYRRTRYWYHGHGYEKHSTYTGTIAAHTTTQQFFGRPSCGAYYTGCHDLSCKDDVLTFCQ